MKKIVFLDQCLGSGGAERVMCTVIRSLDPKKYEIHLVLVSEAGAFKYLIPEHVITRVLSVSNTRNALLPFVQALWHIRPDIVYATLSRTVILALAGRLMGPRFKVIARYASMPDRDIREGHIRGWRLWMMKKLYRSADAVIAQTEEMADQLSRCLRIPSERIHQITNPVDVMYIEEQLKGKASPFAANVVNIVAAGSIHPVKGFDILLEAFAIVYAEHKQFCLHILGSDREGNRAKLERRAVELGVSASVHFLGFQANPYLYYKYCDLFVLSSRCEAMPNVLLECLYFGKPVVATRCSPVIDRLVKDRTTGFLVDVGNTDQMAQAILNYRQLLGSKSGSVDNDIARLLDRMAFGTN